MKTASKTFGPVKEGRRRRTLKCTKSMEIKDMSERKDTKFKQIPPSTMLQ